MSAFIFPQMKDLISRTAWREHEKQSYSAVRAHILLVKDKAKNSPKGPPAFAIDLPARTEFVRERKFGTLTKYTAEILSSVQETITSKFAKEFLEQAGLEFGISTSGFL